MTTIDLILAGRAGHAEHTDPATRTGRVAVVDDWTLTPRDGGQPVTLVVTDCRVPKGLYAVTVASVSSADTITPRHLFDVHLQTPMCVDSHAQARNVAQQLARNATAGVLPFRPAGDEDTAAWRTLITMLARLARDSTTPPAEVNA